MDLTPSDYECWAQVIGKYSGQLVDKIKAQNEYYKYVMDIGSGLGNISALLYQKLRIENLIGVDVDQRMVDYANRENANTKINFLLQDMSKDWNNLRNEIKSLEGQVNLIFSSFAMHFIKDRLKVAENVSKLLAPGGQLQAILFCLRDPFNTQTNGNSLNISIPSPREQMELWTQSFKLAGLKIEQANLFKFEKALPFEIIETYYQAICISYEMFLEKDTKNISGKQLAKLVKEKLVEASEKFIGDLNGREYLRCENYIYTLKVTKIN